MDPLGKKTANVQCNGLCFLFAGGVLQHPENTGSALLTLCLARCSSLLLALNPLR